MAADWDVLRDPKKHWTARCTLAVERLDEPTLGKILVVLRSTHYKERPFAKELYNKLQEFKVCVAAERQAFPHEVLHAFPESPKNLPKHSFDYVNSEQDPVDVRMPGINAIVAAIPLHKSSKLLKDVCVMRGSKLQHIRQEFKDLQRALVGEEADDGIVLTQTEGSCKLHGSLSLKKFKQERSDQAIEWEALPKNAAERALYCRYKADLWMLRAECVKAFSTGQVRATGAMALRANG